MKPYPPRRAPTDTQRVAMLLLLGALLLGYVASVASLSLGVAGTQDRPLEAPPGLGL
jgi:hypothetical protein